MYMLLMESHLLVFQDKEPRGIIPLENLEVRNVAIEKKSVSNPSSLLLVSLSFSLPLSLALSLYDMLLYNSRDL